MGIGEGERKGSGKKRAKEGERERENMVNVVYPLTKAIYSILFNACNRLSYRYKELQHKHISDLL